MATRGVTQRAVRAGRNTGSSVWRLSTAGLYRQLTGMALTLADTPLRRGRTSKRPGGKRRSTDPGHGSRRDSRRTGAWSVEPASKRAGRGLAYRSPPFVTPALTRHQCPAWLRGKPSVSIPCCPTCTDCSRAPSFVAHQTRSFELQFPGPMRLPRARAWAVGGTGQRLCTLRLAPPD